MAYSETIDVVQGDQLPQITVTLRDSNTAAEGQTLDADDPTTWAPLDLTAGTVRMYIRQQGAVALKDTLVGTIVDAPSGLVAFLFGEDTLDTSGNFEAEIEFTDSAGRPQTVHDLLRLKVRAQVG